MNIFLAVKIMNIFLGKGKGMDNEDKDGKSGFEYNVFFCFSFPSLSPFHVSHHHTYTTSKQKEKISRIFDMNRNHFN